MTELKKTRVTHPQEPSEPNLSCPVCAESVLPYIEAFRTHIRADVPKHQVFTGEGEIIEAFRKMTINAPNQRSVHPPSPDSQHMLLKPSGRESLRPNPPLRRNR